jgi:hypothetical protein
MRLAGMFFKLNGTFDQRLKQERVQTRRDGAGHEAGHHGGFENSPQRLDVRRPGHISLLMAREASGMAGVVNQLMNQVHVKGWSALE